MGRPSWNGCGSTRLIEQSMHCRYHGNSVRLPYGWCPEERGARSVRNTHLVLYRSSWNFGGRQTRLILLRLLPLSYIQDPRSNVRDRVDGSISMIEATVAADKRLARWWMYTKTAMFTSYWGKCTFPKLLFGLQRDMEYIRIQGPSLPVPCILYWFIWTANFLLLALVYPKEGWVLLTDFQVTTHSSPWPLKPPKRCLPV